MNATARRPLVSVHDVKIGYRMVAITGSPKTRNLERREGVIVGFEYKPFGGGSREIKLALVKLASGEVVSTHRLTDVF